MCQCIAHILGMSETCYCQCHEKQIITCVCEPSPPEMKTLHANNIFVLWARLTYAQVPLHCMACVCATTKQVLDLPFESLPSNYSTSQTWYESQKIAKCVHYAKPTLKHAQLLRSTNSWQPTLETARHETVDNWWHQLRKTQLRFVVQQRSGIHEDKNWNEPIEMHWITRNNSLDWQRVKLSTCQLSSIVCVDDDVGYIHLLDSGRQEAWWSTNLYSKNRR